MYIHSKEIPSPRGGVETDDFELFARDLFFALGCEIIKGPGRGQNKGRDLLISERKVGALGSTIVQYTVSCKHNAHSGRSVGAEEQNFNDRVINAGSQGFIGFYSTLVFLP